MHDTKIRPIKPNDNLDMAHVIRTVLPAFGGGGKGFAVHDPEVDCMYETYQASKSCFYVAVLSSEVVGGGGIAPLKDADTGICEMQKFYLLERARGHGLGKELLTCCLNDAKNFGYKQCYIETLDGMDTAVALYKKHGFKQLPGPIGNTGHYGCNTWLIKDL